MQLSSIDKETSVVHSLFLGLNTFSDHLLENTGIGRLGTGSEHHLNWPNNSDLLHIIISLLHDNWIFSNTICQNKKVNKNTIF